jgi:SnoaL-like domain
MSDLAFDVFLPTAHDGSAWELAREQLARPGSHRASPEGLREELALHDLIARYAYAADQGDVDGVARFFTNDFVIHGPRGTVSGEAAVRAFYEKVRQDAPGAIHVFSNVVIRLDDDFQSGRITYYVYAILQPADKPAFAVSGLVVDDVVKTTGEWRIRERTVTNDAKYELLSSKRG